MHLLYKVCRADNPRALYNDFKSDIQTETRPYEVVQAAALKEMKQFLQVASTDDVNFQQPERRCYEAMGCG